MWPALTGDVRLACEALLCLSSSTRPSECGPCLSRYFGINERKWSDTIKARLSFLRGCPVVKDTPDMDDLAQVIVNSAGRCDAAYLNRTLSYTIEHTGSMGEVYYTTHTLDQLLSLCAIRNGTRCNKHSDRHTMRIHGQMYLAVEPPFVRPMSWLPPHAPVP